MCNSAVRDKRVFFDHFIGQLNAQAGDTGRVNIAILERKGSVNQSAGQRIVLGGVFEHEAVATGKGNVVVCRQSYCAAKAVRRRAHVMGFGGGVDLDAFADAPAP